MNRPPANDAESRLLNNLVQCQQVMIRNLLAHQRSRARWRAASVERQDLYTAHVTARQAFQDACDDYVEFWMDAMSRRLVT